MPPATLAPVMKRQWILPTRDPESERQLAEKLQVSRVIAALLRNRGFDSFEEAYAYLHPRLKDLEHPFAYRDMEKAAQRLRTAIREDEPVLVYGDYDVDGMTGTVILSNFVRLAGGRVTTYIPNRLKEGYSFNEEAISSILDREDPPKLVLTVDHGTSAHEGISQLKRGGIDVIVTDHHEPPDSLPEDAYAIVNPRRPDCESSFKSLCGAAVGYKLAWATAEAFSGSRKVAPEFREFLLESMALVALATVTDVVPLRQENRILCAHGLRALPVAKNPGLQALLSRSRLTRGEVRAVHLAFRLGPRLNAAGRMGIAEAAIELLTTTNTNRASQLATQLEEANNRRRELEREMLAEALNMPRVRNFEGGQGLCVGKVGWHPGVIGIVAARLVDRYKVPALVAALNGNKGRCSARSIPGINLKELLDETGEHLEAHGGHAGAAGATVTEEKFPAFQKAYEEASARAMRASTEPLSLNVDLEISFDQIRPEMVSELAYLAPHGAGNPPPTFMTRAVERVGKPSILGKQRKVVAFHLRQGQRTFRAVSFGGEDMLAHMKSLGTHADVVYRLKFSDYHQPASIEFEVEDMRSHQP